VTSRISLAHLHAAASEAGIDHDRLHGWAVSLGHNSLTDMTSDELDAMARRIKRDPLVMAAWFDAYEPIEFETMAPEENAEPNDPSLFTPEQWAELHEAADAVAARFRR
jgi:hypothetical protein